MPRNIPLVSAIQTGTQQWLQVFRWRRNFTEETKDATCLTAKVMALFHFRRPTKKKNVVHEASTKLTSSLLIQKLGRWECICRFSVIVIREHCFYYSYGTWDLEGGSQPRIKIIILLPKASCFTLFVCYFFHLSYWSNVLISRKEMVPFSMLIWATFHVCSIVT